MAKANAENLAVQQAAWEEAKRQAAAQSEATQRDMVQLRGSCTALQDELRQVRGREQWGSPEEELREKKRAKGGAAPTARQEEGDPPSGGSGVPPPQEGYPQEQPPPAEFGYFSVRTDVERQAHHILDQGGSESLEGILKGLAPKDFNKFEYLPYRVEVMSPTPTGSQPSVGVYVW